MSTAERAGAEEILVFVGDVYTRRTAGSTVDTCRRQTLEVFWTIFYAFLRASGLRILRSMSPSVASPEEYRKWISLGVDFRTYFRHMLGRPWIQVDASVHGDSAKKFPHFLCEGDLGSRGRALFLRCAWLDSECMFHVRLGAFGHISGIFHMKVVLRS